MCFVFCGPPAPFLSKRAHVMLSPVEARGMAGQWHIGPQNIGLALPRPSTELRVTALFLPSYFHDSKNPRLTDQSVNRGFRTTCN